MIKTLRSEENPRERLLSHGAKSLADTELLALILRSGGAKFSVIELARKILNDMGGLHGLVNRTVQELRDYPYIGIAKAASIKALGEIALRLNNPQQGRHSVNNPQEAFALVKNDIFGKDQEHLYTLSLNTKNDLIAKDLISIGSVNEALVHPRDIFHKAIANNAVSLILVHNHPSGSLVPSKEDIQVTKRVAATGKVIGISLLDHIIVNDIDFLSMKQKKLID